MDKRAVIADDESIIRLDLKEILEGDGYLVVGEAARGDDALEMIKKLEPDLALLDVKMPGLDGVEVARQLKGSNTVVVLLTAFSQRTLI
jgi:response regulator NasT